MEQNICWHCGPTFIGKCPHKSKTEDANWIEELDKLLEGMQVTFTGWKKELELEEQKNKKLKLAYDKLKEHAEKLADALENATISYDRIEMIGAFLKYRKDFPKETK